MLSILFKKHLPGTRTLKGAVGLALYAAYAYCYDKWIGFSLRGHTTGAICSTLIILIGYLGLLTEIVTLLATNSTKLSVSFQASVSLIFGGFVTLTYFAMPLYTKKHDK